MKKKFTSEFLIMLIILGLHLSLIRTFAQNPSSGGISDQFLALQIASNQGQEKALEANAYLFLIKRILENGAKQKDSVLGKKMELQPQVYNILKQAANNCYGTIQPIDNQAEELIKRFQSTVGTNKLPRGSKLPTPPVELRILQEEKNNRLIQCRDVIRKEVGDVEFNKIVQYTNQIRLKMLNKTSLPRRNAPLGLLTYDTNEDVRYSNISFRETPLSISNLRQTTYNIPGVYTYTSIDFDDITNTAEGYASMQMDYDVAAYYHPKVSAILKNDVGTGLASGQFTGTTTMADVSLSAPDQTSQCEDFLIETIFELILIYVSYTPTYYEWYDPFNYYGYSVNPAIYDPYFGFSEFRVIRYEAVLIWVATEIIRPIVCENPPEAAARINIKTPNKTGFIQNTTQKAMLGATIPFDTSLIGVTSGGLTNGSLTGILSAAIRKPSIWL